MEVISNKTPLIIVLVWFFGNTPFIKVGSGLHYGKQELNKTKVNVVWEVIYYPKKAIFD